VENIVEKKEQTLVSRCAAESSATCTVTSAASQKCL